jgi:hypothetical protein
MPFGHDEQSDQHRYEHNKDAFGDTKHLPSNNGAHKGKAKGKNHAGRKPTVHYLNPSMSSQSAAIL